MDDAIRIPGTNIRFGLDPVIGLVPGLGDLLGGAASAYIILEAARAGASASILVRMAANVGIDTLIGALPVIGDLFDFAWKSNARNVRLLARHVDAPVETRRASTALLVAVLGTLALIAVGASVVAIYVIRRLIG
ncbi:MAG: DUF4112 domain-containing protein [Gemmatimonadetes bacterium]|nr:MAG: DUF4112 domain-containing protein [Gemmatimonadota bacterium]